MKMVVPLQRQPIVGFVSQLLVVGQRLVCRPLIIVPRAWGDSACDTL